MPRGNPDNVFYAQLAGHVVAIRDQIRLNPDPDLEARHRAEWPALWAAIDGTLAKIDW